MYLSPYSIVISLDLNLISEIHKTIRAIKAIVVLVIP